jgi:hypothetical protein
MSTPTEMFTHALGDYPRAKALPMGGWLLHECRLIFEPANDCTLNFEILNLGQRGVGNGSRAMRTICELADSAGGVTLIGVIRQFDGGLSNEQLRSWYERNSFTVDKENRIERRPRTLLQCTGQRPYLELFGRVRCETVPDGLRVTDDSAYAYTFDRASQLVSQTVRMDAD